VCGVWDVADLDVFLGGFDGAAKQEKEAL